MLYYITKSSLVCISTCAHSPCSKLINSAIFWSPFWAFFPCLSPSEVHILYKTNVINMCNLLVNSLVYLLANLLVTYCMCMYFWCFYFKS